MSFTVPFPQYDLTQHFIASGAYVLAAIVSSSIFIIECIQRRRIRNDPTLKRLYSTITNISLSFYSLFALFCCPMVTICRLITAIPTSVTCSWVMWSGLGTFWCFIQVFLTFYQMARLKYCFSSKKSSEYGYPNWLFVILTIYGIIIISWAIWGNFHPKYKITDAERNDNICKSVYTKYYNLMAGGFGVLFYIWDWFILGLYIKRIVQFQRMRDKIDIGHKKVFVILQKISLLTIIYEITGIGVLFIQSMFDSMNVITSSIVSLDVIMSSFILFLMIEHNNDYYIKIIKTLNGCHLCCCCKSLIKDVIEHDKQQEQMSEGMALSGGIDTNDKSKRNADITRTTKTKNESTVISTNDTTTSLKYPQNEASNTNIVLGSSILETARSVESK